MEPFTFKNHQAPGDIVVLTAALRDLHRAAPGRFSTKVRTSCPAMWENNPNVAAGFEGQGRVIQCHYPLIQRSNQGPWHFIHGFHQYLSEQLGVRIEPTDFKGDIHLSAEERSRPSQVAELIGLDVPFWIVVAGGKHDFTAKWWDPARMQAVVDHLRGRVLCVQIGEQGHHHPALRGVLDLRGKTTLRQLVVLMHHAQGVISPVTLAMHLAAAVDARPGMPPNRPCVVVAGGREPMQWEAYPHHQYIHTNGALACCAQGGCWKSRTVPLHDGDGKDRSLCVQVARVDAHTGLRLPEATVGGERYVPREGTRPLPRCLEMISAEDVIRRVELYFAGGVIRPLSPRDARACAERLPFLGWDEVLRTTVPGADLDGAEEDDESTEPLIFPKVKSSYPMFAPNVNLGLRPPESVLKPTRGQTGRAAASRKTPLAFCVMLSARHFSSLSSTLQSIQQACARRDYQIYVGLHSREREHREMLRSMRSFGKVDGWLVEEGEGPQRLMANLLSSVEAEYICKLPTGGRLGFPGAVASWIEQAEAASSEESTWLLQCSSDAEAEQQAVTAGLGPRDPDVDVEALTALDAGWLARGRAMTQRLSAWIQGLPPKSNGRTSVVNWPGLLVRRLIPAPHRAQILREPLSKKSEFAEPVSPGHPTPEIAVAGGPTADSPALQVPATELRLKGMERSMPRRLKIGLVIGTYASLPYIHLQLESVRRLHPGVPVLVHDDASPQRERLEKLCGEYGAEFTSNKERLGHTRGDLRVFLDGLAWAKRRRFDVLVKFSRRWVPLTPWRDELENLLVESGAICASNRCTRHGFGFRTECIAMVVDSWKDSIAEAKLRDADEPSKLIFVEGVVHQAAQAIFADATPECLEYALRHPNHPGCGGYVYWPWMKETRTGLRADVLWHEWARPHEYERALLQWGITAYQAADFFDASGNIR